METTLLLNTRIFAIILLSFALTACGGGGSSEGTPDTAVVPPTSTSPAPNIGSPSYPMDAELKAQAPNDGWLKVLATPDRSIASAISGKLSKNTGSNDHCSDGKGNDGDKNKNCEPSNPTATTTTLPKSNPGNGSNNGGPDDKGPKNNDDAENITSINIIIKEVSAYSESAGWIVVNSTRMTVDLLKLADNAAAILASHPLAPGTYSSMRMLLDDGATITVGGQVRPLDTPSATKSGLKLDGTFKIEKGYVTSISLNFDPDKSIVRKGNGKYSLKPVIRIAGVQEDIQAPAIAIVSPTEQYSNNPLQLVRIEYSDEFLDLNSLSILIIGNESKSSFAVSNEAAELSKNWPDGIYSVQAKISDLNHNLGQTDTLQFTVDTIAPQIHFSQANGYFKSKTPSITANATDELSGLDASSLIVSIDGATETTSFHINGSSIEGSVALTEGQHQIEFRIKDRAGNSTSTSATFTVDATPATLTQLLPSSNATLYTNVLPFNLDVIVSSNEVLSKALLDQTIMTLSQDSKNATASVKLESAGSVNFAITADDLAGNTSTLSGGSTLIYDNIVPTIALGRQDQLKTAQHSISLPITVTDNSPAYTEIKINGIQMLTTGSKEFTAVLNLDQEGANQVQVASTDAAGNISLISSITIIRDTTPPHLSQLNPADGSQIFRMQFPVSGVSDEPLSLASVNGMNLTISGDKKSFSGTYVVPEKGTVVFNWTVTDLLGNTTTLTTLATVDPILLTPSLVSIVPDIDGMHLFVKGNPGAARPGALVEANAGFFSFNRGSDHAQDDGSFSIRLNLLSVANVKVTDEQTSESASMTLSYATITTISGIVKDSQGNPLPGATIGILNTTFVTATDGNGAFSIQTTATGDQTLVIDGSTIPQSTTGPQRKFSRTNINVNIGLNQANQLPRPVYLTPLLLDGTETPIVSNQETVIESAHAPGVEITISPNSASFPQGSPAVINMTTINSEAATVPVLAQAVPDQVIALEPSGLTFTKRAEVVLPNDNELPPGAEMLIYSMNSSTGSWEIDGLAQVSDDGQSIVTKPNQGISHFSLIYAVPLKPLIAAVKDPNFAGIDVSHDSLTTSVNLPSYKSLGRTIEPNFVYKSNWANPTAYVSNIFDLPFSETPIDLTKTDQYNFTQSQRTCFYILGIRVSCQVDDYLTKVQSNVTVKGKALYIPDAIRSQFFVSDIASDQVIVADNTGGQTNVNTLPGSGFASGSNTQITEMTGIPARSILSYALPLRNPATGEYLPSGIYPSIARYQIRMKHMVMTTATRTVTSETIHTNHGGGVVVPNHVIPEYSRTSSSIQTYLLAATAPQDVRADLAVTNRVNSPYGRGWNLGLTQKITNPESNVLIIEENNGELSSYSVNNTISTIHDLVPQNFATASDLNLQEWPYAVALRNGSNQKKFLSQIDLRNGSLMDKGEITQRSGEVQNLGFHACTTANGSASSFTSSMHAYTQAARLSGLVKTASNEYFGLNQNEHSLFRLGSGASETLFGETRPNVGAYGVLSGELYKYPMANFGYYSGISMLNPQFRYGISRSVTDMNQKCLEVFGYPCPKVASKDETYSCTPFCPISGGCGFIANLGTRNPPQIFRNAIGVMGISGNYSEGAFTLPSTFVRFNNPSGMTISPEGHLVVADTGNNIVRKFDMDGRVSSYIAGNGSNIFYSPAIKPPAPATSFGIYHPLGVVYDDAGNLYISTEDGYIRKVDRTGTLYEFAGKPLELGGTLANEAFANQVVFNKPHHMVIDNLNQFLYVSDTENHRVMRIDLKTMIAKTVAGTGVCDPLNLGDGGPALSSSICSPGTLGLDDSNNLIVHDTGHKQIRRIAFSAAVSGTVGYLPTSRDNSKVNRNVDGSFTRTYRDGSKIEFNSLGYQVTQTDAVGNVVQFSYDNNNRLSSITDATGQISTLSYSGNLLTSFRDPGNRLTTFSYSGNSLTRVNFPDNTSKRFEYDQNGLMTKEYNQRNSPTTYQYNAFNRLEKVTDALGHSRIISDMTTGSITNGYTAGQVGTLRSAGTDPNDVSTILKDAKSNSTTIALDFRGYISTIKNSKGEEIQISYDLDGNMTEVNGPGDYHVRMTYNPTTRDLLSKEDVALGITENFVYDSAGRILSQTNGNGNVKTFVYNNKGLLTRQTDPNGNVTDIAYDSRGLPLSRTVYPIPGQGLTSLYEYDQKGNLIKETLPDGKVKRYSQDLSGNVVAITLTSTGNDSLVTTFNYDEMNRLTSVTSPKNETTEYTYSPAGELIQVKDPDSKIRTFVYDQKGRVIQKTDPLGHSHEFNYDGNDNLVYEKDPNENTKTFSYDELDQLMTATLPDDVINYQYGSRGEITTISNSTSTISYSTDARGLVRDELVVGKGTLSDYPQVPIEHDYDENGKRTLLSSTYGSISYGYDVNSRLVSMATSWGQNFGFQYDNANLLKQINRPGSISQISYLGSGAVSSIEHIAGGTLKSYSRYSYDLRNLPTQKRQPAITTNYGYDFNGQLTSSTGPVSETFTYDKIGNRISDQNGTYTYDSIADQRLTEDYEHTYTYDNNGNLIQKIPKNSSEVFYKYTYSSRNQLVAVEILSSTFGQRQKKVTFSYDAVGRRIEKKVEDFQNSSLNSTMRFIYDGENILFQFDGSNNLLSRYAHSPLMPDDILSANINTSGVQAGLSTAAGNFYYLKDSLGTVTDVISESGEIIQSYNYSAFGKILSIRDGLGNITTAPALKTAFTFTGKEWDEETGLYYYRARYYNPSIGRFLQTDPHPGKLNLPETVNNRYVYTSNGPTFRTDPSGKFWPIVIGAIAGAIIGAIDASINGGNFLERVLRGAVGGALFGAAIMINPTAGIAALGIAVASASAKNGNFFRNLNDDGIQNGAAAVVGAAAVSELTGLNNTPFFSVLFKGLTTPALAAASVIGITNSIVGLTNQACDPERGGLYRSDFCSISRGLNGN